MSIRIGTRASKLARWQANWVASALAERGVDSELVLIETTGDVKTGPIATVGGEGLFTKEIQRALLEARVDVAVHSLKDLPTDGPEGLMLAAVPERAHSGDALVTQTPTTLSELPAGARVGTGSARRRAQLLAYRDDLDIQDLRGNVDTRLGKVQKGELDAVILAQAGLDRLGLGDVISERIGQDVLLPAVGQGALGLEIRAEDTTSRAAIEPLNHLASYQAVLAERALLRSLRGGCLAPIGAWARFPQADKDELRLDAVVLANDGTQRLAASGTAPGDRCEPLGQQVAEELVALGADALLARPE